jgi:uncharacterized protein YacL
LLNKVIFFLACSLSGYCIVYYNSSDSLLIIKSIAGLISGLIIALIIVKIEKNVRKYSLKVILGGVAGIVLGLFIAFMFGFGLNFISKINDNQQALPWIYLFITIIFSYLGLTIGANKVEEISFAGIDSPKKSDHRILDTSVIIEGRIADICDSGFIEGELIVPRFVLNELQLVADSSDSMKRLRGRRGLDVLNHLQKSLNVNIEVIDQDFPKIKGVDGKLVALAKQLNAKLITNDYNLNKVAELQGIRVLNINELANAMKPVVLPGEQMTVKIVREGKEAGQGVAYLDDGTMIIVENAHRLVNINVHVVVTSVLQTTAGRMIFSELKEIADKEY